MVMDQLTSKMEVVTKADSSDINLTDLESLLRQMAHLLKGIGRKERNMDPAKKEIHQGK